MWNAFSTCPPHLLCIIQLLHMVFELWSIGYFMKDNQIIKVVTILECNTSTGQVLSTNTKYHQTISDEIWVMARTRFYYPTLPGEIAKKIRKSWLDFCWKEKASDGWFSLIISSLIAVDPIRTTHKKNTVFISNDECPFKKTNKQTYVIHK